MSDECPPGSKCIPDRYRVVTQRILGSILPTAAQLHHQFVKGDYYYIGMYDPNHPGVTGLNTIKVIDLRDGKTVTEARAPVGADATQYLSPDSQGRDMWQGLAGGGKYYSVTIDWENLTWTRSPRAWYSTPAISIFYSLPGGYDKKNRRMVGRFPEIPLTGYSTLTNQERTNLGGGLGYYYPDTDTFQGPIYPTYDDRWAIAGVWEDGRVCGWTNTGFYTPGGAFGWFVGHPDGTTLLINYNTSNAGSPTGRPRPEVLWASDLEGADLLGGPAVRAEGERWHSTAANSNLFHRYLTGGGVLDQSRNYALPPGRSRHLYTDLEPDTETARWAENDTSAGLVYYSNRQNYGVRAYDGTGAIYQVEPWTLDAWDVAAWYNPVETRPATLTTFSGVRPPGPTRLSYEWDAYVGLVEYTNHLDEAGWPERPPAPPPPVAPPANLPLGAVIGWPEWDPPEGWLRCDGRDFSVDTYPELAALLSAAQVPDFTENVPRGPAPGRVAGTSGGSNLYTMADIEAHTHTLAADSDTGNHTHTWDSNQLGRAAFGTLDSSEEGRDPTGSDRVYMWLDENNQTPGSLGYVPTWPYGGSWVNSNVRSTTATHYHRHILDTPPGSLEQVEWKPPAFLYNFIIKARPDEEETGE